jgi:predicted transcriptional regulator
LRAMRDRGETLREIARMAGAAEKTVREMIREADAIPDGPGAAQGANPGSEPPAVGVEAQPEIGEVGRLVADEGVAAGEGLAARAQS